MFSHFFEKFENSKWPPFLKIFSKVAIVYSLDTLGVENFDEIALSLTVKEIEAILFSHFFKNFENSKWPPFLKIVSKVAIVYSLETLGVENFDEIALSPTVKEIEAILCFRTFSTKIQNGCHFGKIFSKVGVVYSLDTLGVENWPVLTLKKEAKGQNLACL